MEQGKGAARRTPYEVVFGAAVFEDTHFPAIAAEAEARSRDASDPGAFVMLGSVGELLRTLRPDDADAATAGDAVLQYGALVFQAYHFRAAGYPLFSVDEAMLERLIERPPIGVWPLTTPAPSGYVQLPRNRLWVGAETVGAAEPVDGFFWTRTESRLDLVVCTGLRADRPGLGAIDVAAALPADPPGHWGDLQAREAGDDFGNILPGGELDGLHGLTTSAEVLKLASRLLWFIVERSEPVVPTDDEGDGEADGRPTGRPAATSVQPGTGEGN